MIEEQGEMLGIMPTADALLKARELGLDLIEVSPKASPPVVKLLSFDKYRYQQEKAQAAQRKKQKKVEVKGIRVSVRIGAHDLAFKAALADKFLAQGNKVKIEMLLRGREKANLDFAVQVIKKFLAAITAPYTIEQEAKKLGSFITVVISPKTQ